MAANALSKLRDGDAMTPSALEKNSCSHEFSQLEHPVAFKINEAPSASCGHAQQLYAVWRSCGDDWIPQVYTRGSGPYYYSQQAVQLIIHRSDKLTTGTLSSGFKNKYQQTVLKSLFMLKPDGALVYRRMDCGLFSPHTPLALEVHGSGDRRAQIMQWRLLLLGGKIKKGASIIVFFSLWDRQLRLFELTMVWRICCQEHENVSSTEKSETTTKQFKCQH